MTRPRIEVEQVLALGEGGMAAAAIARTTGIPRSTLRYWLDGHGSVRRFRTCDPCEHIGLLDPAPYAYLLGLYLGDGCLSSCARGVYRLRIVLDAKYPGIIDECSRAMAVVLPNKVGWLQRTGCVEVYATSKHWACLFPQHGTGPKHLRPIVLTDWQSDIALDRYPYHFLRGLILSDGWRGINRIGKRYQYPCYQFSNRSTDIQELFRTACRRLGIAHRQGTRWQIAVSKRADVERMDLFIGPKR